MHTGGPLDSGALSYRRFDVSDGVAGPLGAQLSLGGTNFALHAPHARTVAVVLPDHGTFELNARSGSVWHGLIAGVAAGQEYAFEVDGVRLLDPYARHVTGGLEENESALHGLVVDTRFDWEGDAAPRVPWDRTVVYEAHARGLTMLHADVPDELRGTYAGLAHPAVLDALVELGVTTVELLPVHHFVTEPSVAARGLVNYWGYNTAGYFAPHAAYAHGDPVVEFKQMVQALHGRGLEIVLDVVFNHTCEGGQDGPLVHLRGLDDDAYYRHLDGHYFDVTGCGNTLRTDQRVAGALVLDALRYWVNEMHVDGFRFDLASALARVGDGDVDLGGSLIQRITDDPVLSGVKLIAEPWDASMDGYLVGGFPAGWSEWNDGFRDDVRDFWRGAGGGVAGIATRLTGSSEVFAGRATRSSINFVTAHDGFTLRDLVSYEQKHNEANGEDNNDGHSPNRSWNCGVEGETEDATVLALRGRQAANLIATTILSAGTPMLLAGDESGHTQYGNNNAYCHDSALTWTPWSADPPWAHLRPLVARLLAARADHPVLRQQDFFTGEVDETNGREDLRWLHPDGSPWEESDWAVETLRAVGMILDGDRAGDVCAVVLLNAGDEPVEWALPGDPWPADYEVALDTAGLGRAETLAADTTLTVAEHSLVLLLSR